MQTILAVLAYLEKFPRRQAWQALPQKRLSKIPKKIFKILEKKEIDKWGETVYTLVLLGSEQLCYEQLCCEQFARRKVWR